MHALQQINFQYLARQELHLLKDKLHARLVQPIQPVLQQTIYTRAPVDPASQLEDRQYVKT
jgi:hypothetical protein